MVGYKSYAKIQGQKKKKKQNLDGKGVEEWRRSHGFQIWILDIFEVCLHAVDISSDGQFRTETDM